MIPVRVYDECQCDPRKCTAKRMLRFGLAREAKRLSDIPPGSVVLSHVNDGGFWLVKEYFNMSVAQTFKTWTVLETLISVTALLLVMALSAVL